MPTMYRGAPLHSYWHTHDATRFGFNGQLPTTTHSVNIMIDHILGLTSQTPYTSLTFSYGVARAYAEVSSVRASPTAANPAYVYLIDLSDPLPTGLSLYDPVKMIANMVPPPPAPVPYQHEGTPDYLLGVVDPNTYGHFLIAHRLSSSAAGGTPSTSTDTPSSSLVALVRALRDSEILACGLIPPHCIRRIPAY